MCSLSFKSYAVAPLSLWHDQNSRSFSGKITILVCKFTYSHMNGAGGVMHEEQLFKIFVWVSFYGRKPIKAGTNIYDSANDFKFVSIFASQLLANHSALLKPIKHTFYTFEDQGCQNMKHCASVPVYLLALRTALDSCLNKWSFFAILLHLLYIQLHSYHQFSISIII